MKDLEMDWKYWLRIGMLLIVVIVSRIFFSDINQKFYDYISYVFSIGLLILILLPNLHQFKFWGIEAKNKDPEDNTNEMEFVKNE